MASNHLARSICVACMLLLGSRAAAAERAFELDGVAARVNGHPITVSEVLMESQPAIRALDGSLGDAELRAKVADIYTWALDSLLADRLIYDAYLKDKEASRPVVPQGAVDARIDEIVREEFGGDRLALLKTLAAERVTYAQWRERMERQIVVGALVAREVHRRVQVAPSEVLAVYEERLADYREPERVRLARIVIGDGPAETRRARAEEARRRIVNGEPFEAVAREMSTARDAAGGGEWGWIDPADLRAELAGLARNLAPGEVGGILDVQGDFYLLKVLDRKPASVRPFIEVQRELEAHVRRREAQRLYDAWVARLKRGAHIEIYEQPMLHE